MSFETACINRFEISPILDIRVSCIAQPYRYRAIFLRNVVNRIIDFLRNSCTVEFSGSFDIGEGIGDIAGYVNFLDIFTSFDPLPVADFHNLVVGGVILICGQELSKE